MMFRSKYPIVWDLVRAAGWLVAMVATAAAIVAWTLRLFDIWPYL